jgi:superfamily II DNA/RNA helicase
MTLHAYLLQLLEMGFRPAIERILSELPNKNFRQTLLFSATVPASIKAIAAKSLKDSYAFVDTVGDEVVQTHESVAQELLVAPLENTITCIACALSREMQYPAYKIIVFFTTARQVRSLF